MKRVLFDWPPWDAVAAPVQTLQKKKYHLIRFFSCDVTVHFCVLVLSVFLTVIKQLCCSIPLLLLSLSIRLCYNMPVSQSTSVPPPPPCLTPFRFFCGLYIILLLRYLLQICASPPSRFSNLRSRNFPFHFKGNLTSKAQTVFLH